MSQTYVVHLAVLAGNPNAHDAAAEVGEADLHAIRIGQDKQAGGVGQEVLWIESRLCECGFCLCISVCLLTTGNHCQACCQSHAGKSDFFHLNCFLELFMNKK